MVFSEVAGVRVKGGKVGLEGEEGGRKAKGMGSKSGWEMVEENK